MALSEVREKITGYFEERRQRGHLRELVGSTEDYDSELLRHKVDLSPEPNGTGRNIGRWHTLESQREILELQRT